MAVRRIDLALQTGLINSYDGLNEMALRDVERLLSAGGDPNSVAKLLKKHADYHDNIVAWVETLAPELQLNFLKAVRRQG